jgi:hypothetical protein
VALHSTGLLIALLPLRWLGYESVLSAATGFSAGLFRGDGKPEGNRGARTTSGELSRMRFAQDRACVARVPRDARLLLPPRLRELARGLQAGDESVWRAHRTRRDVGGCS